MTFAPTFTASSCGSYVQVCGGLNGGSTMVTSVPPVAAAAEARGAGVTVACGTGVGTAAVAVHIAVTVADIATGFCCGLAEVQPARVRLNRMAAAREWLHPRHLASSERKIIQVYGLEHAFTLPAQDRSVCNRAYKARAL